MMNPEKGELEPLKEQLSEEQMKHMVEGVEKGKKTLWDIFTSGEIVIVKNSYFRVHEITPKRLILRPMKVVDNEKS